jgi:hypothetical protein
MTSMSFMVCQHHLLVLGSNARIFIFAKDWAVRNQVVRAVEAMSLSSCNVSTAPLIAF